MEPDSPREIIDDPIFREEAEAYLRNIRAEFGSSSTMIAIEVINFSDPASAIVAFSNENAVDLIVMVSHSRSGLNRLLLGSVTEKVLQAASRPVLIVPRKVVELGTRSVGMVEFTPNFPDAAT